MLNGLGPVRTEHVFAVICNRSSRALKESNMNKALVLLLLVLCSFSAVPQSLGLADHLASAAHAQRAGYEQGSPLRLDPVGLPSADADGANGPAPIKVVLIGLVVVCFIAVRRVG